jgi:predicted HTH transcriptional regulator
VCGFANAQGGRLLLGAHSSSPFNPPIANAFSREGEIEALGRGVERIFVARAAAGTPKPVLRYHPSTCGWSSRLTQRI